MMWKLLITTTRPIVSSSTSDSNREKYTVIELASLAGVLHTDIDRNHWKFKSIQVDSLVHIFINIITDQMKQGERYGYFYILFMMSWSILYI